MNKKKTVCNRVAISVVGWLSFRINESEMDQRRMGIILRLIY